jgi:hypothetical protein
MILQLCGIIVALPKNTTGSHAMSTETVCMQNCPHCGGAHSYVLEVERAIIIRVLTTHKKHEKPSRVKVTQLFACPLKNEQYQAAFYLQDTSSDRIKAVGVIGLSGHNSPSP